MEFKNLKKTIKRILKAVKNKEKIILYGDADLDGASSVIIFKETLRNLGVGVRLVYFPDRENEGYGINEKALNLLKKEVPALLIAFDCGIGNLKEVKLANKLGFEVIIIDHHEPLEKLPEASFIIDPKQKGDKYPFKELATAALAFKISQALLINKFSQSLKNNFLELVALATLADMMPQTGENIILIEEGLKSLNSTFRPGLKVFFEIDSLKNLTSSRELVQKIISALNTPSAENHLNHTYLLLTVSSQKEAKLLALDLLEKAQQKQIKTREITERLKEKISRKLSIEINNPETGSIIFEGDPSLPLALAGPVASKICNTYRKPTFIFNHGKKESQGAVRMPGDLNGVKALINCKKSLKTYGGHPRAAGFRLESDKLDGFRKCLVDYFKKVVR
jgi:single-stranded-DNA-specific exonuclease